MKHHIPDSPESAITPAHEALIEKFQCPGCLRGSSVKCGRFATRNGSSCSAHVCGTVIHPVGFMALGMPKGFCRPGFGDDGRPKSTMSFRFWPKGTAPEWDHLNVAVWAMEKDGHLFVRTCLPRVAAIITDVIEGGTLALCPGALDVSQFAESID